MSNNATSNVFAAIREAAIELEGLAKNGETESSSAGLCAKKFKFALGKRPVQSEFLWMPVLLHGPLFGGFDTSTKSKLAERLHDQTATAKLVEKGTKRQAWFRLLCRNFDLRYLGAYNAAVTAFAKRGRPPADVPHDSVRSGSRGTGRRMALEGRQASKPCQRQCLRSAHKPWIPRILNE